MSLGESILDHYELFLGKYIGVDKYTSGEYVIQPVSYTHLTLPTICSV